MKELKFNSQICTTKEQSQRLLDLGLKHETADMRLIPYTKFAVPMQYNDGFFFNDEDYTPAWSLHRLFEMICNKECDKYYYFDLSVDYDSMVDVYNSIIEVIERHIKENRFNKKYLKQ